MDPRAALILYDEQMRRDPHPAEPDAIVEREPHLTRVLSKDGNWGGVCWSSLEDADVDAVIAAEIRRFSGCSRPWEWKHYSYDLPPELPERLIAAGFEQGELETVLVAELAGLSLEERLPAGLKIEIVEDEERVSALLRMQNQVFGGEPTDMKGRLLAGIAADPPSTVALAVSAGGEIVAGGRVEFEPGVDFAGLWGAATVPAWRSRGIFRALVARSVALARERGYRYAQLDALPTSRPILERLGFIELAGTTPFTYPAPPGGRELYSP